ncbi:Cornichon protein, putative [Trypanosoma equiperdum]|uniref:Cornichon protein n=3 Tax=Trypanozoon TaxID=39700 RepID=Q381F1_TRYB2|nr:hypothetical protein, conserved [Trypanosoma brucei gambiense DAL972]XP_829692.1 hypothetical protein, conserved [Trypanosoma brucei brucei TREU927]EAN80580.1 hypothetical protein, conserved [Trypanosoma brucei brucei TREU927]CBH18717.1 hypothetical protein, conserved [Trypanosoma brucei gambiense DAL972]SCU67344.1 Cornichon protein, putative [Trypanosoma equiperdum]|eukprot:XP_011780981.1 hypothetical protein, conserved [Trypanosoma brucei gambiense DAL972]
MGILQHQADVWHALRYPSKHSWGERKRAYLFVFAYCLAAIALFASVMHFIGAWIACGLLQVIMLIFAMLFALNIADCRDKCLNVLECERAINPVMEVYIGLRFIQFLHATFLLTNIPMGVSILVALLYSLWRMWCGTYFVDATSLWREVGRLERDSYIHICIEIALIVIYLIAIVFAMVDKYS